MSKQIFYDNDARSRLLAGAEQLYNAVKTTMGPKGRNVIINKSFGAPTITHDGVTVAKGFDLSEDGEENYGHKTGAELIKQAASKMNDVAGDGTTTVTVLTYHILKEANQLISAGHNPMQLRKGLEKASSSALKRLQSLREDIGTDKKKVAQIATISAGDESIGNLIADVMDQVGKDGVVTVEEGQSLQLESDVVEGFTFDKGFISPYMVTDTSRMEAVYDKPSILITDKKISSVKEILPIIEKLATAGKKNLVIIGEDVDGEALGTLVLNKLKGVFNTVAIKAPAFGDRRIEVLEDIAILTGGTLITDKQGYSLEAVEIEHLGSARRVIVNKDETTLIEGSGDLVEIKNRIAQIKSQANIASSEYDKEEYLKRGASLQGKVAVIKVGGATETEIEEKKFRVDDAVHAVKAALDEGIVPGGGVTLIDVAEHIQEVESDSDTIKAGFNLLKTTLRQPFRIILDNAGLNADEWLPKILEQKDIEQGIDVSQSENMKLVNMKKVGIIDPVRVVREAIQNAVSIAGTSATMGALIVDIPDKNAPADTPVGGGMPGMGM
ncbi:MAG: chaperonin GroEL [Candidatus Saccharibacteria bacterium]|nr:chaperonin GroEL [Candidatus Saccharibacteria bacterium]MCY4088849.1 chaperonin GroEL [Candidatus Saccharibacteria bacterium]